MRVLNLIVALSALLPLASASLSVRVLNDPVQTYFSHMCYPLYLNATRRLDLNLTLEEVVPSLAFSPFPCEQGIYLYQTCMANGTTEIDFLAEQECLCHGSYFEAEAGCNACYFAHGYQEVTPEAASTRLSSLSVAECAPTPPFQPYANLIGGVNITSQILSQSLSPPLHMGIDKFPNNTAVSNYATVTTATPGVISGSATGRLTSWTNTGRVVFTPTSIPPNSGTGTGSAGAVSTTSPASKSTNMALAPSAGVGFVGGCIVAGVGIMAMM